MKDFLGGIVPFLVFHVFCCGALLIFLTSSGYLLILSREGKQKTFLIPVLLLMSVLFFLYKRHGNSCHIKAFKTPGDHVLTILLYVGFSLPVGIAFMIYVFIPWWIPNYTGGPLLP